jgi:hypothetical protein
MPMSGRCETGGPVRCVFIVPILGGMKWLQFVLVPVLIAVGMLAYFAYQDALDVEQIVAVGFFLVLWVPLNIFAYRRSQRLRER